MESKKEFIEYKQETVKRISCNHPMVERIWQTGALAAIPNEPNDYQKQNNFKHN